ncbi:MAG TPA: acetyl-CoA carboxylase biotin carboxyl carrier protein [Pirellulales bacterium]|jgi:acetyl-CoA carboxylase biotin carboxyl carrier protein|nr:acetyl-CoA carboxylase biotin carboxyl carrier protein [Pirellulales bacterium]
MAGPPSNSSDIFDLRRIRRLVELMNEHDLAEIDLRDSAVRIRLRKHHEPLVTTQAAAPLPQAAVPGRTAPPIAPPAAPTDDHLVEIKSIMVGTFFTSPSPEAPAFVKVGDRVGPDTVVCIIEAMKVFNEIPSGVSGKVVAVLVDNGDPVEFGQPLFKVDPRQ